MTVKKLSDSDKQEILNLYRQTGETTSTLAERYGVSNSTISRLLKSTLPGEEYEALISLKRAARTPGGGDATSHSPYSQSEPDVLVAAVSTVADTIEDADPPTSKRLRRRSSASELETEKSATQMQLQLLDTSSGIEDSSADPLIQDVDSQAIDNAPQELPSSANLAPEPITTSLSQPDLERRAVINSNSRLEEDASAEANAVAEMLGEDLLDDSEELMELEDEDEDLEDLDEDDLDEDTPIITRRVPSEMLVQVLPLSEALLPKTCYLVIDRASELITRPLRDFGDLGQIPIQEVQQKTLPVFDNHRVARRFSTKRDRVIKVPDSRMLQKACSHLQAKGITRLLIDGQVYSLSNN